MDLDLGSIANGDNGLFDKGGVVGAVSGLLAWAKDLTSGLGYFLGGDFEKALGTGFMK